MTEEEAKQVFAAGYQLGLAVAHAVNKAPTFDEWWAKRNEENQ